jgi:phage pi2 protein 07
MNVAHVTVVWPDDEHVIIEINGEEVASANYDEHGWSGMDAVVKTATAVAKAAGLDIHIEGVPNV